MKAFFTKLILKVSIPALILAPVLCCCIGQAHASTTVLSKSSSVSSRTCCHPQGDQSKQSSKDCTGCAQTNGDLSLSHFQIFKPDVTFSVGLQKILISVSISQQTLISGRGFIHDSDPPLQLSSLPLYLKNSILRL